MLQRRAMQPCFIAYGAVQNIDYVALHNRKSGGFLWKGLQMFNNRAFQQVGEAKLLAAEGQRQLGLAIGAAVARLVCRLLGRRITTAKFQ